MKALAKEHTQILATYAADPFPGTYTITRGSNWEQINGANATNGAYLVSQTYFDMAGMTMEEKTLFIEAAAVQEGCNFEMTGPTGAKVWCYDLITSIPFTISDWDYEQGLGLLGPNNGGLNFEHVVYGRFRLFANDVDFAGTTPVLVSSDTFGSGQPTNSDRLYSYRILIGTANITQVLAPPARHLIIADAREEPEYSQLMRMKRSYELQQSYDED